jgi:hypothetical protein
MWQHVGMEEQGNLPVDIVSEIQGALGRKREHMTTLSVRIPIHLHDQLRKVCEGLDLQQNELVVHLLKPVLPKLAEALKAKKNRQREMAF